MTIPERALGADQQAAEVVPGDVLAVGPAEREHLAGRDDGLQARHPRAGRPVLEGVRPAGVGRDVAADLRLLGGAGVGREVEPVLAREALHVARGHAGLGVDPPQRGLQFADRAQALQRAHHPAVERHRSTREAGAAAARDQRDVALVAERHHGGHLGGAAGAHDEVGAAVQATAAGGVVVVRREPGAGPLVRLAPPLRGRESVLGAHDACELAL